MKRRFATGLAKYAFNPIVRTLFRLRHSGSWHGDPRDVGPEVRASRGARRSRTASTGIRSGSSPSTGAGAAYVLNIEANPRVRIRIGRRWVAGTAQVLPDDDPQERLRAIGRARRRSALNVATVRAHADRPDHRPRGPRRAALATRSTAAARRPRPAPAGRAPRPAPCCPSGRRRTRGGPA